MGQGRGAGLLRWSSGPVPLRSAVADPTCSISSFHTPAPASLISSRTSLYGQVPLLGSSSWPCPTYLIHFSSRLPCLQDLPDLDEPSYSNSPSVSVSSPILSCLIRWGTLAKHLFSEYPVGYLFQPFDTNCIYLLLTMGWHSCVLHIRGRRKKKNRDCSIWIRSVFIPTRGFVTVERDYEHNNGVNELAQRCQLFVGRPMTEPRPEMKLLNWFEVRNT